MQATLSYREIRFSHVADRPIPLVGHPGSMVRGVFGHALKAVLCSFPDRWKTPGGSMPADPDCLQCLYSGQCAYAELFMQLGQRAAANGDTPKALLQKERPDRAAMKPGNADQWPAPYVLDTAVSPDGRTLDTRLVLFGRATGHAAIVVEAVRGMGAVGFGNARMPMRLVQVAVDETALFPDSMPLQDDGVSAVRLRFDGTLLKSRERLRQTDPLPFDVLVRALLRRQSLLAACHGEPWDLPFGALVGQAREVRLVACRLSPFQWQRTSTRTGHTSRYDAFCGEVTYEGALVPFLPFLRLGEVTQVGSGTVFGMGRYVLDVVGRVNG